jgi:diaminohydroxyphosphoribosylaminopyrimidine deaminase/5-amino-6-(5-phosphoribosylamino)uracil reductase
MTRMLMHKQRTEEDAILVGTRTVLLDNPWLTVRHWKGRNPLRVMIDRKGILPKEYHLFDDTALTFVWDQPTQDNREELALLLEALYRKNVQSLIVEGGATLLNSFIEAGLWDEANVETCFFTLVSGVKAPVISGQLTQLKSFKNSLVTMYNNIVLP